MSLTPSIVHRVLVMEITSFRVVVPIWEVLRLHAWTVEHAAEVMQQIHFHMVTAVIPFCAYCTFFFFFLLLLHQGVFEVLQMALPQQAAFSVFSFSTFL